MFKSKLSTINTILTDNIHGRIKAELKEKLLEKVEEDIEDIVNKTVDDLVMRMETFMDLDGSIKVNVQFKKEYANA